MSADNYVAVLRKATDDNYDYYVVDGNASMNQEDCQYVGHVVAIINNDRPLALTTAHNYADKLPILEYGVSEGIYPDPELCGKCHVCVYERKIIADDVERCDHCKEPFTTSDWQVSTNKGTFHNSCERQATGG